MSRPKKIRMPSISFVVARTYPKNVIGCDNQLPWRLKSDLRLFKKITLNHSIIMGSNTFYSIGKVLPKRENVVISRKQHNIKEKDLYWCNDRETAILLSDIFSFSNKRDEIFVIGGQKMYKLFGNLFNKVHLTEIIDRGTIEGDAFFNFKFDRRKWRTLDEQDFPASDDDQYPFRYSVLENRAHKKRYEWSSKFLTDGKRMSEFVDKYKVEHPESSANVDALMYQEQFPSFAIVDED